MIHSVSVLDGRNKYIGIVTEQKYSTQLLSLSCRRTGANTENNNYYYRRVVILFIRLCAEICNGIFVLLLNDQTIRNRFQLCNK